MTGYTIINRVYFRVRLHNTNINKILDSDGQPINRTSLDIFGFSELGVAFFLLSHGALMGHLRIKKGSKSQHKVNNEIS